MTIQALINKIFRANQTQNNTVSWSGSNGLKSIQEDIVDTIRQRTFFTVPTTAALANQGFNNAILCYVQDNAFFRWQASGTPNGTTIFPANDGGVWVQETIGDTDGTVTSIGITAPAAFTVTNSPVTTSGVIDIAANGTSAQYIKGDGTLGTLPTPTGGTVTNVSALTLNTSGTDLSSTVANPTTTPVITLSVPTASAVNRGVLSPTDWSTFNSKQNAITLTTTGTSGAATLVGSTLNIPQYQSVITNPVTGTGTTNYLSKWTSSSSLNNSLVYDDGTNIGIGTTTPSYKLDVNGTGRFQTSITIGGAADATLFFPNTTSGHQMRIYTQYASNAMVIFANGYNLNLSGGGGMTSNFATTITGTNGNAALTVQQGNVAWTPVLKVNAIGSTGTQFNTNGNVLIGTTTDAGYKLDIVGTTRFQGNSLVSLNQNAETSLIVSNTTSGTTASSAIKAISSNGGASLGKYSATSTAYKTVAANDGYIYNYGAGNISILNDFGTGNINFTSRGSSAAQVIMNGDTQPLALVGAGSSNFSMNSNADVYFTFNSQSVVGRFYANPQATVQNTYNQPVSVGFVGTIAGGDVWYGNMNGSGGTVKYNCSRNGVSHSHIWYYNFSEQMRLQYTGNLLIGTSTDAGYKLDVNGTGIFRNVLTGYVNSGSLVLGAAAANSQAITITGYYTSGGAISTTNSNPRSFNVNIGGQGYGFSTSYNGNTQVNAESNSYFRAVGAINITAGTIALHGYNFSPTITSETNATIYAFSSTLNSASNHYDLYLSGGAKSYIAGSVGIGTTPTASYKLDLSGTARVSGTTTLSSLGGGGTQMVVADNTGVLSTQAIPSIPTKSFGAWQEDTTQTAASSNTGYGVKFSTPDISGYGVNVINDPFGDATYIEMVNNGVYNIQFSLQLQNTDGQIKDVTIWLRKNGNTSLDDIPATAGFVSVPNSHGGTPGTIIAAWNYFVEAAAGDFFQLVWSTSDHTRVSIEFYPAGSPPPSAASAILTVNQVN
jgi:hypothetical protein